MTISIAADSGPGHVVSLFVIPVLLLIAGVVLLVRGLKRRSARRIAAAGDPGQPGGPNDSAQPASSGSPPPEGAPAARSRRASSGTALIIMGAVLIAVGLLFSLASFGALSGTTNSSSGQSGSATGTASSSKAPDPCSFATTAEISKAVGYEVEGGRRTAVGTGCYYDADGRRPRFTPTISIFDRRTDLDHGAKTDCLFEHRTPVSGIGVEAFDCGYALFVRLDQESGFEVAYDVAGSSNTHMAVALLVAPRISAALTPH